MACTLLNIIVSIIVFSVQHILAVNNGDIVIFGPGLKPDNIVLPARYFFISSNGAPLEEKLLYVSITGKTVGSDKQCQVWKQIFPTHDGNFIVRYKVHETCLDMKITVKYNGQNVGNSTFVIKGPVYQDDCNCPEPDINRWFQVNECNQVNKQIDKDLSIYNNVNFDDFYEQAAMKFNNSMQSSICHYIVKSNKVYRTCYGKYVDFKGFMDALLLSLTRKVTLPDIEFFSNLGDWPLMERKAKNTFPMFSWCGSDSTLDIVMPTYDMTESSLEMMGRVSRDMLSVDGKIKTKWDEKENKAFFRGRDSSRERLKLIDIARKRPDLINASLTNFFFFRDEEKKYGPKANHISFFDFFDDYSDDATSRSSKSCRSFPVGKIGIFNEYLTLYRFGSNGLSSYTSDGKLGRIYSPEEYIGIITSVMKKYPLFVLRKVETDQILNFKEQWPQYYKKSTKYIAKKGYQFSYKYQLNLDGTVAAYRFPYLLAGNSLVFKQDSKYYEHFYNELKPWKHYVPVKSSLDDLIQLLEWALENDDKAREIAAAGRNYARNNLMPQHIFCYHAHLFNEWSKKLDSKVIVREGMELVEQKNHEGCNCRRSTRDEL